MKIGWLLGWSIPEAWFAPLARAAFPSAAHTWIPAEPDALDRLAAAGPFDWLAGYSLGALLLLSEAERAARLGRVALLAPIFAFPTEAGLGGRIPRTQVRYLARQLRRDPVAARADFYARAGLDAPAGGPAASLENLLWGLDRLETAAVAPRIPAGWAAWCGAEDALLDAARLHELAPEVRVVPGATHHPDALLRAFAADAK